MHSDLPRTYRASAVWHVFAVGLGGALTIAAALGVWYFGGGHDPKTQGPAAITLSVICLLFFTLGAYLIYSILHFRVVLTTDAIEVQTLSRPTLYPREMFAGWRIIKAPKGPDSLNLVFSDRSRRVLKFPLYFRVDATFREWLAPLADLDKEELLAAENEIATNDAFGLTTDERLANLASARRTAILLNIVTAGACVWALFFPQPYSLAVAVLALLPWVAVVVAARARGLIRIDQRRNDPHPFVAIPFLMPGFILALRAIFDIHLIGWQTPLVSSVAVGVALWYSGFRADTSMKRSSAVVLFLLLPAYGFGVFALSNAFLDHSLATRYAVHVIDKYTTSGRSTSYNFSLEPWGPETSVTNVGVSRSFYDSTAKGSTVCVYLRSGALRTPWYIVRRCPQPR